MDSTVGRTPRATSIGGELREAFAWRRVALAALLALIAATVLNPQFKIPFVVVLGRLLVVAALLLVAFGAAGAWRSERAPKWLMQLVAVVVAAPLATLVVYLPTTGGNVASIVANEALRWGFLFIAGSALVIGPTLALVARDGERAAHRQAELLALQLERKTLEKQALDARFAALQAQVEPHFLFNTLANVQALVESGSPQAAPVLRSLIAYLRAALPQLHDGAPTLGRELGLVRAYLEVMRMRMPDRLEWSVDVPADLQSIELVPMSVLTLVENAVRHGIDPAERGGRIDVVARNDDGRVRIAVTDTGRGLADATKPGTGLANLRERLKSRHGASARVELAEVEPHGVRAEIVVDVDMNEAPTLASLAAPGGGASAASGGRAPPT